MHFLFFFNRIPKKSATHILKIIYNLYYIIKKRLVNDLEIPIQAPITPKNILMKKKRNILIVQDDPDVVKNIKTFFGVVFDCEFETKDTFVKAYETILKKKTFDIVILPEVIRGFKDGGLGQKLIPLIRESPSSNAKVYFLVPDNHRLPNARKIGVNCCLHHGILDKKPFVVQVPGTPLVLIPKALRVLSM